MINNRLCEANAMFVKLPHTLWMMQSDWEGLLLKFSCARAHITNAKTHLLFWSTHSYVWAQITVRNSRRLYFNFRLKKLANSLNLYRTLDTTECLTTPQHEKSTPQLPNWVVVHFLHIIAIIQFSPSTTMNEKAARSFAYDRHAL